MVILVTMLLTSVYAQVGIDEAFAEEKVKESEKTKQLADELLKKIKDRLKAKKS